MRHGFAGLWDRLTGDYQKTRKQNEAESFFGLQRDRAQRHELVTAQLAERRLLQERVRQTRTRHAEQILALHKQAASYRLMGDRRTPEARREFNRHSGAEGRQPPRQRPERGLDLGR